VVLLEDVGSLAAACLPRLEEQDGELALPQAAVTAAQDALDAELDSALAWCAANRKAMVVVSLEVGLGTLPLSPAGRLYKDVIGSTNQRLASRVDRAFLVIAGVPVDLTALGREASRSLGF
jgi:adenosylcobinamide kinase/adenosylcobinamide-phosphate guanylyltransferase